MSDLTSLGAGLRRPRRHVLDGTEHVVLQQSLNRVLAFVGHSIDDVVNDPIVKNKVIAYYKLHKTVRRGIEVVDLERQWNRLLG